MYNQITNKSLMETKVLKTLLIFPPLWPPMAPYLAIPSLLGQLENEGFDAEALDLNVEFYNDLLKKSYLKKSIKNLKKIEEEIKHEALKYNLNNINEYPINIKEILLKNNRIQHYLKNKSHLLNKIPKEIEKAVSRIKNKKEFYKPETLVESINTVGLALEIASLRYSPARILLDGYKNPLLKLDYETIKYNIFSSSTNIFMEYYEKWMPVIKKKKPDLIGISITSQNQLLPGLTLANMIKKNTNAHISLGGNYLSRIIDDIKKHPDFFELFTDSILINEGEKPIVELAKHIDGKIKIEEVPNIIYKKDNEIFCNEKCTPLRLNQFETPTFKGFDFSKYITPEIALPLQTTRGCYWGKCTFCDIPYGKEYSVKNIDVLIDELKEYKKKFKISHFCIVDESIHPNYLEKMADKIIENKLEISYYCPARTEKEFTPELFKKLRESGLKMIMWGIESGSERIMELMNKGVDTNERVSIVKSAAEADIWNHAFGFMDFPTETIKDAEDTINFLRNNSDIMHSCSFGSFFLGKHSEVKLNPEKYGIKHISTVDEFATFLDFEEDERNMNTIQHKRNLLLEMVIKYYDTGLWKYCKSYHYLFLYISKYGIQWVKNYEFKDLQLDN